MDLNLYISIIIVDEDDDKNVKKIGLYKNSNTLQSVQMKFDYSEKNLSKFIANKLYTDYNIELKDINDLLYIDHFADANEKIIIYCFKINSNKINNKKIKLCDLNILKDIKDIITLATIYTYLKSFIE